MISCFSGKLRSAAEERDIYKRHQTDSRACQTPHRLHPQQEHPRQPLNCSQTCEPAVSGSLESLNFSVLVLFFFIKELHFHIFKDGVIDKWQIIGEYRLYFICEFLCSIVFIQQRLQRLICIKLY